MNNQEYGEAVNAGNFPDEVQIPIDPAFIDERGSITNIWLASAGSITVITSLKGSSRASHYHKGDWHSSYIISGSVKYTEADIDGSNMTEQFFTAGQSFFSKPMKWHRMDFPEDTTFITMNGIVKSHDNYENSVVRIDY